LFLENVLEGSLVFLEIVRLGRVLSEDLSKEISKKFILKGNQ